MTIVTLDKVTLCGLLDEKAAVLDALQGLGCLHLMTLGDEAGGSGEVPERAEHAVAALRYLLAVRDRRKQVRDERGFDFDLIVGKVLDNRRRRRELEDERDSLQRRIANLEPWGNFRFPQVDALGGHRLWFYRMPLRALRRFDEVKLPWQVVHRDNQEAYVVVISKQPPATGEVPAHRVRVGTVPLADLRARLESTELELEDVDAERHALSRWIHLIGRNLAVAEDRAALLHACAATRDEAPLFVVQGWLPRRDRRRLEAFARERALALQVEAPGADDVPPTLLDNPPALAAGQDVVGFYQVPPYRSWDPPSSCSSRSRRSSR